MLVLCGTVARSASHPGGAETVLKSRVRGRVVAAAPRLHRLRARCPVPPSPALSQALHTLCCPLQSHTLCPLSPGAAPVTTRSVPSALSLLSASVVLDCLRRSLRPYRLYCSAVQVGAVLLCTAARVHGSAERGCTSTDGACSILLCRPLESLAAGCCWPCSSDTRSSNSRCTSQPAKETLRSTRSQRACYAWSVY